MSLYVVPVIYTPLMSQPLSVCASEYPHLKALQLADGGDAIQAPRLTY